MDTGRWLARAQSLLARQSQPLSSPADIDDELVNVARRMKDDPGLVGSHWRVYRVVPTEVEFLQGSPDRRHIRLKYVRTGDGWQRGLLWP